MGLKICKCPFKKILITKSSIIRASVTAWIQVLLVQFGGGYFLLFCSQWRDKMSQVQSCTWVSVEMHLTNRYLILFEYYPFASCIELWTVFLSSDVIKIISNSNTNYLLYNYNTFYTVLHVYLFISSRHK